MSYGRGHRLTGFACQSEGLLEQIAFAFRPAVEPLRQEHTGKFAYICSSKTRLIPPTLIDFLVATEGYVVAELEVIEITLE